MNELMKLIDEYINRRIDEQIDNRMSEVKKELIRQFATTKQRKTGATRQTSNLSGKELANRRLGHSLGVVSNAIQQLNPVLRVEGFKVSEVASFCPGLSSYHINNAIAELIERGDIVPNGKRYTCKVLTNESNKSDENTETTECNKREDSRTDNGNQESETATV